ncbi:MAG: glycosyltransferase [bacterium]|nr:glycosyltransferase [bacterium]
MSLDEIRVGVQPIERLRSIIPDAEISEALASAERAARRLSKRVVWNINSTAVGGGVAEMLPSLLGYTRALGIDTRWLVIDGNPDFFRVTKRLHHALHGQNGDGSPLGDAERRIYEDTLRSSAIELQALVGPGDVVILHDPQTAGLAPYLTDRGIRLVWRCHIGSDTASPEGERGWAFLAPYLACVPHFVFSRAGYVPEICDHGKSRIIHPSIDPLSAKNQELSEDTVHTILVHTGLIEGPPPAGGSHAFERHDGSPGRVARRADVVRCGRAPSWETPLIVQVSRWDPLKDMAGVMEGFSRLLQRVGVPNPALVLAGPDVKAVADDPEGAAIFEDVVARWRELPEPIREHIHLANLPTEDVQENAAIVNALQRHASVVVQKSLKEGFGLTVTEAMWKGRPVVASAIGGIQDQIQDGLSGILLRDPTDLDALADALQELLADPARAAKIGDAAREQVREKFLGIGHLLKYARLFEEIEAE